MTILYGIIIGGVGGIIIGGIGSWLLKPKNDTGRLSKQLKDTESSLAVAEARLKDTKDRLDAVEQNNKENIVQLATANEKVMIFNEMHEKMTKEFKAITFELLEHQKKSVTEEQFKTVKPVSEQMEKLKDDIVRKIHDMQKDSAEGKGALDKHMKSLLETTGSLQKNASDLASALKYSTKAQGDWGEFQLGRIFEMLGFEDGREYVKQVYVKNEDGNVCPDYILNLPNNRRVIIDSKVSLESFIKFVNAEDEAERKTHIKKFVADTKKHIDVLGKKEYQNKIEDTQLDYVVLFLPLDNSLLAALTEDPTLYQYAFKRGVVLTTPTLLLPMMRTIDILLKIDRRNKNIDEVIGMVNSLYEKFCGFAMSFKDVGDKLSGAQKSYDMAKERLTAGRGNMSGWIDKIREKSGIKSLQKIAILFDSELGNQTENRSSVTI